MVKEHLLHGPLPGRDPGLPTSYNPTWLYKERFILSDIDAIIHRLWIPGIGKFAPPPLTSWMKDPVTGAQVKFADMKKDVRFQPDRNVSCWNLVLFAAYVHCTS